MLSKKLLRSHRLFAANFEAYADLADEASLYDTSYAKPLLIASKVKDGLLLSHRASYAQFRARASLNDKALSRKELYPDDSGDGHGGEMLRASRPSRTQTGTRTSTDAFATSNRCVEINFSVFVVSPFTFIFYPPFFLMIHLNIHCVTCSPGTDRCSKKKKKPPVDGRSTSAPFLRSTPRTSSMCELDLVRDLDE